MGEFWVVGPIAWDQVLRVPHLPPSGGFVQADDVTEWPGGSGANAAIALASTGATVHMVGYVGDDEPGARLQAVLAAASVNEDFVCTRDGHTSEVVILVEPSGERAIIGIWPDLLHTVPVPEQEVRPGDVVYFAAWRDEFVPAMSKLTERGATVATVPPPLLAPDLPASFVIGSEEQYARQDPRRIFSGPAATLRAAVVTLGSRGVVVHERERSISRAAQPVVVVNTTGAGDAFAAGFLHQVAAGSSLEHAVAIGVTWAATAVESPGSIPPPWEAVRNRIMDL